MNIAEIESNLAGLVKDGFDAATFPFKFLEIYDAPKATVSKLRQGSANQAVQPGDILWKNKLFFRSAGSGEAAAAIDALGADELVKRHRPRFLMATDGREFHCRDLKADQALDIDYGKLNDRFDFFLPLAGIERFEAVAENPADVKATGRLAKLYDAILEANPDWAKGDHTHELNQFMTRLLFCFFAEDTSIFEKGLFSATILLMTREDGGDTDAVLRTVFSAMATAPEARAGLPAYAAKFPYVNGGLFAGCDAVPVFSARARRLLRECGALSWQEINPDIFGSMIQAIVEPGMRGDMGMHYTSVPNIMKVLQPLFLLSLEEAFEAGRDSEDKLRKLLARIYNIRVFDPACGSGNFLIIAYRELRKLENRIFSRLKEIVRQWSLPMTGVKLNHFYGIELADFAAETAKLSLWIAEFQMNELFDAVFGSAPPALPLKHTGNIIHGNATRLDWLKVCPPSAGSETYVVGNPPYLGRAQQTKDQKADIAFVFSNQSKSFKKLDYVACWTIKGSQYCKFANADCAFVTTNSICQGEQVALLWPHVYSLGLEIGFAHQSFKWQNNASDNAGVTCVIVGLRPQRKERKLLYSGHTVRNVSNISPYLIEGDNLIVYPVSNSHVAGTIMSFGNMPRDNGNLILTPEEKDKLVSDWPQADKFIRRFYGSQEFIKGIERYCLWIEDSQVHEALLISPIQAATDEVRKFRLESDADSTVKFAEQPHRFVQIQNYGHDAIIIPRVSSEKRKYFPVGLVSADSIISDAAFGVYDPPDYLLSILSSRLHAIWVTAVGGQLETRLRYSNTLVYNTFPIPNLSADQKSSLEDHTAAILGAREAHPGKTIAWLYDPETMPANLLKAHTDLDDTLERIYIGQRFRNDTERLEHLFKLYSLMIKNEKPNGTVRDPVAIKEFA